jgi:hypothetical protein
VLHGQAEAELHRAGAGSQAGMIASATLREPPARCQHDATRPSRLPGAGQEVFGE